MPMINKRFTGHKLANSIIGHSLGGLFVFYCLLKEPDLFSDYYALSPALWVHHGGIYDLNKYPSGYDQPRYLFFSAGSLEIFNRILFYAQKAAKYFESAKPRNFSWQFQVIKGKRHHTQVPSSLQLVFLRLRS